MPSGDKVTVRLPHLAVSFLAEQPDISPTYKQARQVSENWLIEKCGFVGEERRTITKGDFSYFCAVATPKAGFERFRIFCDWVNWVFPFDDLFDNGRLKDNPDGARAILDNLIKCLYEADKPQEKFVEAHCDIWHRFWNFKRFENKFVLPRSDLEADQSQLGLRNRFIMAMTDYADAVLRQVKHCSENEVEKIEDMIVTRRDSIAVRVLHVLMEYAHELSLPDEVFEDLLIKEIQTLGVDWVLIHNDLLSYCREGEEDVTQNLVSACRLQGMSAQEAFDHLGSVLEKLYTRFDAAIAERSSWDEAVDVEVGKYVEGVKSCVKANLGRSFHTDRYFGETKDEVKRAGKVDVLAKPLYLRQTCGNESGAYQSNLKEQEACG